MSRSKAVSLDAFREKKLKREAEKPFPGVLVWLYCPTCKTIEYTEVTTSHGRTHKCGTIVEEEDVPLDLRAELTVSLYNIHRIDALRLENKQRKKRKLIGKSLDKALQALKRSEEIYLDRLNLNIPPYPGDFEEIKEKLPIKEKNELGLYITEFRFQPENRFKKHIKGL